MRGTFQRGRGGPRGNFNKRTFRSRGSQRGRPGRRFNHFKHGAERFEQNNTNSWLDSKNQRSQRYDDGDDYYEERYEEDTGNDYVSEKYEDDLDNNYNDESYDDNSNRGYMKEDYNRDDREFSHRTRHESDTLEYLEREQYSRDDFDYQDREYERGYENEYERDDREEWRYDRDDSHRHGNQTKYSGNDRNFENDREQNFDDQYNRHESYDEYQRKDYSRKDQYNKRSSFRYDDREKVSSGERNFNKKKRDDDYMDSRNTGLSGSNYRHDNVQNERKGRYHQKNWIYKNSSSTSGYDSMKWEKNTQSVVNTENTEKVENEYDWSTNESGIKMAIEFLKNKSVSSENVEKESSSDILNEEEARLPIIKPELLSTEAIDDLVSDLLNLVLKNGGEIANVNLEKEFIKSVKHRFKNGNVLKSFLKKYPQIFEFEMDSFMTAGESDTPVETEIVRAKTEVKLCQAHSNHPKSCPGECNSLHICKFYILSSCEMTKCKFGHNLSDDHNILVQQKFYLHRVELPNLCLLLQHDANRCPVTIPVICRFYQGIRGCRNDENIGNKQPQKCPFLHICQKFVEGDCKMWSSCRRNHNMLKFNVHEILCKFGLDPRVLFDGQKRVFALLRSTLTSKEGSNFMKNTRNRYIPIQIKINEENARLGLKRKVQVGGDDDISVKIQKVMDTSLGLTSSEKLTGQENVESTKTLNKSGEDGEKMNENRGTNESFDKNMNLSEVTSNEENRTTVPSWSISDNNKWTDISQTAMKNLEEKYQQYMKAKSTTVLIDGKYLEVDFSKLEGCYTGSSKPIKVRRKLVKKSMDNQETPKKTTEND